MAEEDYKSIRVSTLRGDLKIPFDIYVKVGAKYIHYCRAGDSFEGNRLDRLKAKKLKKMFLRPEDMIAYSLYLEQSIDQAYDEKSGKPLSIRAEVIQGFQQAAAEDYMEEPGDQATYNHVRSSAERFVDFLEKTPAAAEAVLKLANTDQSISHHSVNVATLTTMMVLKSKFKDTSKMTALGLGCMLHDIDHYRSGFDVTKSTKSMTAAELATYHEHPMRGGQALQSMPFVDQITMNVVMQHEELSDGSGYPKGLVEKEIEPVVMLAATANAFDRLTSFHSMSAKDAIKNLLIDKMGQLPLEHLRNLQEVLRAMQLL